MLLQILQNNLILLLILMISLGLCGLFLFNDYLKKISSLSISYANFILLLVIISKNSEKMKDFYMLLVTILIIFSVTLATGIGIVSNIARLKEKEELNNAKSDHQASNE